MKVVCFLLCMFGASNLAASAISPDTSQSFLRLIHKETGEEISITQGETITCHLFKRRLEFGKLNKISSDSLTIGEDNVALTDLKAITYYPSKKRWQGAIGGILRIIGTFFFLLTSIGIASILISPTEGAAGAFYVFLPVWLFSLILLPVARWLRRKGRYSMDNYRLTINN